jgi:hypothetical protein
MAATSQSPPSKTLVIASLLLAGVSFSSRWTILPLERTNFTFVFASVAVSALWALLLLWSVSRHGKRGLWLLVGAPFVLWWPCVYALLLWTCHHGYECF